MPSASSPDRQTAASPLPSANPAADHGRGASGSVRPRTRRIWASRLKNVFPVAPCGAQRAAPCPVHSGIRAPRRLRTPDSARRARRTPAEANPNRRKCDYRNLSQILLVSESSKRDFARPFVRVFPGYALCAGSGFRQADAGGGEGDFHGFCSFRTFPLSISPSFSSSLYAFPSKAQMVLPHHRMMNTSAK